MTPTQYSKEKPAKGTGIQYAFRPHNSTPWNVWHNGQIIRFCASYSEALGFLAGAVAGGTD